MKIRILIFYLFAAGVFQASAQTESVGQPSLPDGKLVKDLPAYAQWDTVCFYTHDTAASQKGKGDPENQKSTTTKTGEVLVEVTTFGDGLQTLRWCIDGIEVLFRAGGKTPEINYPSTISASTIPGTSWISKANYHGIENIQGHTCFVFQDKVKMTEQNKWQGRLYMDKVPMVDATAKIDTTSLLPFSIVIGDEIRTFQFSPQPTARLTVPANVQAIINPIKARLAATPPPRPRP